MRKNILLAGDDEPVRKMVGRVLESADYAVIPASTGWEAIAKCQTARPDLLLVDADMRDNQGWEAISLIRRTEPSLRVLVITARPDLQAEAVRNGIDALMEKPLDPPVLLQTIEALLEEPRKGPRNGRESQAVEHQAWALIHPNGAEAE